MVFGAIVVSLVVIIGVLLYLVHTSKQLKKEEFNNKTRKKKQ